MCKEEYGKEKEKEGIQSKKEFKEYLDKQLLHMENDVKITF